MPLSLDRRRFLAGALVLPLAMWHGPVEAQEPQEIPATHAGQHLAWTIDQLNNGADGLTTQDIEARFTKGWLEALSARDLIKTFQNMSPDLKPVSLARLEGGATDQHATALLTTNAGYYRINLACEFDDPWKINDYWFQPVAIPQPPARPRTWQGITSRMSRIAPYSGMWAGEIIDGVSYEIASYRRDELTPIASTFKLYVLASLGKLVAEGRINWSDTVTIENGLRSLPSGLLHYEPAGSTFPLEYVAERMTAESDNTATDHCIHVCGRQTIERDLVSFGHSTPLKMQPLMYTREWFAIRMRWSSDEIDSYLSAPIPERRTILEEVVDPIADTLVEWEEWPGPAESDRIEWFASPGDLGRLLGHLQQYAVSQPTLPVGNALCYNNGICFDPADWKLVGFKEGYETGLKVLTWLLQRQDGRWFGLTGYVHDLTQEIDGESLKEMMLASAALLANHP
jgi:hypothetical protein